MRSPDLIYQHNSSLNTFLGCEGTSKSEFNVNETALRKGDTPITLTSPANFVRLLSSRMSFDPAIIPFFLIDAPVIDKINSHQVRSKNRVTNGKGLIVALSTLEVYLSDPMFTSAILLRGNCISLRLDIASWLLATMTLQVSPTIHSKLYSFSQMGGVIQTRHSGI